MEVVSVRMSYLKMSSGFAIVGVRIESSSSPAKTITRCLFVLRKDNQTHQRSLTLKDLPASSGPPVGEIPSQHFRGEQIFRFQMPVTAINTIIVATTPRLMPNALNLLPSENLHKKCQ